MVISTQHSEHLKTVRSKEVAVVFWSRCGLTFQTSLRTNTLKSCRADTNASLAKQAAVSKKQAALREAAAVGEHQKIADKALGHQAEIEAKTRVEEGTAAELKSQVEMVINKDEMIDVIRCTRGHGYKGVVNRWCAPGCRGRHIVVSGRMRVLERGIQPAFSGEYPVQVNQVSITEAMLDKAREECNRLEL